jgi:hypothetical protein
MRQVRAELRRLGPFDVHHCRQVYLHTIAAVDVALETKAACVSTICSSGALAGFSHPPEAPIWGDAPQAREALPIGVPRALKRDRGGGRSNPGLTAGSTTSRFASTKSNLDTIPERL